MITDAELTTLGLGAQEITDLKAAIASAIGEPKLSLILKQYTPQWYEHDAPYSTARTVFACGDSPYTNRVYVVANDGTSWTIKYLPSEDSSDQAWVTDYTAPAETLRAASWSTGNLWWINNSDGLLYYAPLPGNPQSFSEITTLWHVAAVSSSEAHVIGVTSGGNWRLAHIGWVEGVATKTVSDIYWPYKVRSFSAVRMGTYDIIAMVTDLPPIADFSVNSNKLVKAEQWVQGIVLWKFDNVLKKWSDHWTFDIADNHDSVVRANVQLSKHGSELFMLYAKEYGGNVGLALTKSADGINWENPIFYTSGLGGDLASVTEMPTVGLVRNGKHLYMVGGHWCRRAVATEFVGVADTSLVQDVTDYIMSMNLSASPQRSVDVELGNPAGILTDTGLLSNLPISLDAYVEIGYQTASGPITIPVMSGFVSEVSHDSTLPVLHLSMKVSDKADLVKMIGTPEAQEWSGLQFGGDNYNPAIESDTIGSSGLGHTAIHAGTWTGGCSTDEPRGLSMKCNNEEGRVMSTFISRAFCGWVSAEISFYEKMAKLDFTADTPAEALSTEQTEYAGICFRVLNDHNMYWLRFKPCGAAANTNYFRLIKRVGVLVQSEDDPDVWEETHTDTEVGTEYSLFRDVAPTYSKYYSGRLTVEWRYHLINVYRREPGGTPVKIITYEVPGFGTASFNNAGAMRSYTAGNVGFLAFSPKDGYETVSPNADCLLAGYDETNWTAKNYTTIDNVAVPRTGGAARSMYDSGSEYWYQGMEYKYPIGAGTLSIPSSTVCRADGYIWIAEGDSDPGLDAADDSNASVTIKLYSYLEGIAAPYLFGETRISDFAKWMPWSTSFTIPDDKVGQKFHIQMQDRRSSRPYGTADTVFYANSFRIQKKIVDSYVYFGNVDCADMQPTYTVSAAMKALYAYAGHHDVTRRYVVDDHFTASNSLWTLTTMTLDVANSRMHGAGNAKLVAPVYLPLVVEAIPLSTTGTIGVEKTFDGTSLTFKMYFEWTTAYAQISINQEENYFVRRIPTDSATIPAGSVIRLVFTSQIAEGTLANLESSAALDWMTMAIYVNGRFLMSGSCPIQPMDGFQGAFYFKSYNDVAEISLDRVTIDELHRTVPFFSIDPGEMVTSGIGRLVGASRVTALSRYDGNLLVARKVLPPTTVYIANTITFVQGITSTAPNRIYDSANGLGVFSVGQHILASGFSEPVDNRWFTISAVDAGGNYLTVAGDGVTTYDYPTVTLGLAESQTIVVGRGTRSGKVNAMAVPAHFRLVGAWDELDVIDPTTMDALWRHTFSKKDDANLITQDEMRIEQDYLLNDIKANLERVAVDTKFNPLLEYGDYVLYDGEDYLIDSETVSLVPGNNNALVMKSNLNLSGV